MQLIVENDCQQIQVFENYESKNHIFRRLHISALGVSGKQSHSSLSNGFFTPFYSSKYKTGHNLLNISV